MNLKRAGRVLANAHWRQPSHNQRQRRLQSGADYQRVQPLSPVPGAVPHAAHVRGDVNRKLLRQYLVDSAAKWRWQQQFIRGVLLHDSKEARAWTQRVRCWWERRRPNKSLDGGNSVSKDCWEVEGHLNNKGNQRYLVAWASAGHLDGPAASLS